MNRVVWGWVALSFHDPDSDDIVVRGMKICAHSTSDWKFFTRDREILVSDLEVFEDELLCWASPYTQEGDVLSLRIDELPRAEWATAEKWWSDHLSSYQFKVDPWQDLPHEDGIRPHLTPSDQIRSDELEELLEYLK